IDGEKAKKAIAAIEKSAKEQGQLIDDLLDVSGIQAGKVHLEMREIDPIECITVVLDSVRTMAEAKGITIQTSFDPAVPKFNGDVLRMQQVLRNLLTNAIKFTPAHGKITVRSRSKRDPDRVEIQVEDTGIGIKPEFLPYVFTRFSQADSSSHR